MRNIWRSIIHTSGTKIYALLIGIVTLSLTARLLGPEGRGQVAAVTTWVSLFSTFTYLSLGQVALHRLASDRQRKHLGPLLGSLLLLAVLLTLIGWAIALAVYVFFPNTAFKGLPGWPLLLGFLALPFLIWEQYGSSLLIGLERIKIYNNYQVIGRSLSVVAIFLLVAGLGWGVEGVLAGNLIAQMLVALGGIGFLLRSARESGSLCRPTRAEMLALLSGGLKLHLNAIGTFLFSSANVLILNHYHGAEQTGYFQLASQLLGVLMIIPQAASMVIYGKVATLGPNGAWPYNKRLLMQITLIMTLLSAIAAMMAQWSITLLAGENFKPAVEPFQWMLLGLIGMTFSTVMAPQWIGRGYFWQAAGLTFLVGVINLGVNLWLIPLYGMQGAVYAFLATYLISVFGNGAMAWHCESENRKKCYG
ncbi:MAG: oligosaccharide flippase family protein [Candidatus Hadarchaeum sp.]